MGEFNSMPIPGLDTEFDVPYNILTNSRADNAATIYATGCLPARFTSFDDNIFATVRRVSLRREPKDPLMWRATVHYSSAPLTEKEEQQAQSPLDRPAEIDWETMPYQMPVLVGEQVESGVSIMRPILNSAYDTPDPVPEKTEYFWVANVTKNLAAVPDWTLDNYAGSVNSASFTIEGLTVEAKCARLSNLRISKKLKENDVRYRTITFSLEFRGRREQRQDANGDPLQVYRPDLGLFTYGPDVPPPPFDLELADMGLHRWDVTTSKRIKHMTDDSPPRTVGQAVAMDGVGGKLTNPTYYNIVLRSWRILRLKDFTVLPLT
jgi:hypothetical protein